MTTSPQETRELHAPTADSQVTRHQWLAMLGIVALALALRLAGGWMHGTHIDRDTYSYVVSARALLSGEVGDWFYGQTKPPVFGGLLAIPMALGADGPSAARYLAILAGVALLHPAWLTFRRMGTVRSALLGLLFLAVLREPVVGSARITNTSLNALLVAYMVYFLAVRGLLDGRLWAFAVAGLLAGLASLNRTESLAFLPLGVVLALIAAGVRRLPLGLAVAGVALFLGGALVLVGPNVALMSAEEGQLTIRRNAGQFLAYSAGASETIAARPGEDPGFFSTLGENLGALAARWFAHLGVYLGEKLPHTLGYLSVLFVLLGAWAERRRLLRWGPLPLTLVFLLWLLAGLSMLQPHGYVLLSGLFPLAYLAGRGSEWLAGTLVARNPAGLARPQRAYPWLVGLAVAASAAPSVYAVATTNPYENRDLLAAAAMIRQHARVDRPVIVSRYGQVPLEVGGRLAPVDHDWQMDREELAEFLARSEADYLVLSTHSLSRLAPWLDPSAPPPYLQALGRAKSHPKAEPRVIWVHAFARPGDRPGPR